MTLYRPDLAAVLVHYGFDPPHRGGWAKALCPVHDESRPSAVINLDIGRIHCHACGFSGDALDLLIEKENADYATVAPLAESFPPEGAGTGEGGVSGLRGRGVHHRARDHGRRSGSVRTGFRFGHD